MTQEERTKMATIIMVERYITMMNQHDIAIEMSEDGIGLPHAHWMLRVLRENLTSAFGGYDICKANRWLGFIQHEIISAGWTTVSDERNFSRMFFKGSTSTYYSKMQKSDG